MGRVNLAWATCLVLGCCCLTFQSQTHAAQQKKNDDQLKIGNGALLRRIFGNSDTAKPNAEKSRPTQKDAFEATRKRIANDTERLKEKLGFKQPSESDEDRATAQNAAGSSSVADPRAQFAPQMPNRRSISDQLRNPTPATPTAGNIRPPSTTEPARLYSGSPPSARQPSGMPSPNSVPRLAISDDRLSDNRLSDNRLSDNNVAPRNQPRVPTQPTYATPRAEASLPTFDVEGPTPTPVTFGAFGIIVDAKATGLLIKAVKPKSVAAHIGLRPGDTIKNVAGLEVSVVEEIDSLVEVLEPEDEFEITYIRDGKPKTDSFSIPKR